MGGCKCSFFGCKRVSDCITHFFKYPVKDEGRCVVWLQRAGRMESFSNLTVTQLGNKFICQHHFEEKMFSTFRRDRLEPKAIPKDSNDKAYQDFVKSKEPPKVKRSRKKKPEKGLYFIQKDNTSLVKDVFCVTKKTPSATTYLSNCTPNRSKTRQIVLNDVEPSQIVAQTVTIVTSPDEPESQIAATLPKGYSDSTIPKQFVGTSINGFTNVTMMKMVPLKKVSRPKAVKVQSLDPQVPFTTTLKYVEI